jgi:Leucine-rich repeat (LRR) protein
MTRPTAVALALLVATAPAFADHSPDLKLADDPSKLDCDWAGCSLVTVTDAARKAIEGRKDFKNMVIRFARDSTDAGLATVTKLPWLKRIDLHGNITDLGPLARMTNLEEVVFLETNPKSLEPIVKLPALTRLAAPDAVDLASLEKMTQLRDLSIKCKDRACIATVAKLSWLTKLSINNGFSPLDKETLAPLAALVQLEQLSLMNTGLVDLSLLAGMTKLRTLNLQRNEKLVDIEGLRKLPELIDLTIQNGNGARKSKVLFELPKLQRLFVEDSLMPEKDKVRLRAKRKDLDVR